MKIRINLGMARYFLLFFVVCISHMARVYAQQENQKNSVTFKQACELIKKDFKCEVIYNETLTKGSKQIKYVKSSTVNATVQNIINQSGLDLSFTFKDNTVVFRKENKPIVKFYEVNGTVKDTRGYPISGVSIRVLPMGRQISTDKEGRYKLYVETLNSTLQYSYIGKVNKQVKFSNQSNIDVVLDDDMNNLEEVVLTGYQKIDKRELTSSIETIKGSDLDRVGALTLDQMLEGKASGLMVTTLSTTPGAASKVRVRSGGTFTGSRAPLWVVDGVIYEDPVPLSADDINSFDKVNLIGNALTGINPQDIETINILKDASATAIYGVRAANGVIVVTTKRGKKERANLSYSGSSSVVDRPRYSNFNLMNSKERVDVSREIEQKNLGYPNSIFTYLGYEKALYEFRKGMITFEEFQRQVSQAETRNTDWFGELYRPAVNTAHNVNLSGGTDSLRYYFSVGYNDNKGTEKGVDLNRITARSNIDLNLRKNLLISVSMSGSIQEGKYNHSSINLFNTAYYNSRTTPFRNEDGSLFYVDTRLMEQSGIINKGKYNVMHEMNNSQKSVDNKDLNISAQLNWDIFRGVKLRAFASTRNTTNLQDEWIAENTNFIANLRTYDGVEDKIDAWVKQYATVPFGGVYSAAMTQQSASRGQLQLNYTKTIARHVFNANVGYELNSIKYKGSSGWASPGYSHEYGRSFIPLKNIVYATGTNEIVGYEYANALKWMTGQGGYSIYPTITDRLSNSVSAFLIFNYSYDNRYIFNFNMRSDGSNSFGQYERYKFKPTWSVSGRWNIHQEKFFNLGDAADELALRVSYGFRGNPPSATPYMVLRNYQYDADFGEMRSNMASFPNASLTWEKTSTLNIGLNHSWLEGRLSGAFDFAYSHGSDLLLSRPVSLVNGRATQLYNGGEKKDYSYEASLRGVILKTKKWGVSFGGNATMTREKVLAGYEAESAALNVNNYLGGSIYLTGFPVDAFYAYQFDGLDNSGLPKYKNLEKRSETIAGYFNEVLSYMGRRSPQVYGGFNTEVRYSRLTLRAGFSYKFGHKVRLLPLYNGSQNMPMPEENMSAEFNDRWRNPGDEAWATIPGLSNNRLVINSTGNNAHYTVQYSSIIPPGSNGYNLYDLSDQRVVSGNHIRWQSLSLNYNLNDRFTKRIGLRSTNVGFSANSLGVWTFDRRLKGQDPEQVTGIGMPALPTYSFSLSFSL
ncbi:MULTISPECIES: SusC/RagA family TonB-linked outer membrane protein [Sphingobacterium]|uniref:SusC/RagA family TonB-linked outer membrane protein n=1 Tax=Sphingobacterium TaxID=28453 RepID=UPI0013DBDD1F|nr:MULTISPECIES: SusC/RagA family TonB-linked outer membrane protein [unclassified Sphingobacterium]